MKIFNKIILLLTGHLAGYQIVTGIENYSTLLIFYYTIFFGILLITCLLILLFDFEILKNRMVVIISTLLPLSFSLGMIKFYYPDYHYYYLCFCTIGFLSIFFSRFYLKEKIATIILALVHGAAGLLIFFLPIILVASGKVNLQYSFVSFGGALIGIGGLLLVFLKMGKPILSKETIYNLFPVILLLMTIAFILAM